MYLFKEYLTINKHKGTAFFRWLLHYRVYTRVGCASPSLTASRKLVSSTRHWERSNIAVRSRLLIIKHLREHKNNGCTHMHTPPYRRTGMNIETLSPQNNRTMELNVNFLLTVTIKLMYLHWHTHIHCMYSHSSRLQFLQVIFWPRKSCRCLVLC